MIIISKTKFLALVKMALNRTYIVLLFAVKSLSIALSPFVLAADDNDIERIRVEGATNSKSGEFVSASQGWVSGDTLAQRPMLRTGEMLEFIPGMMVTQHSGSGKANQYFLRGFNLDHGTDFAVNVDGMPVNMRSHGHGQGYSDINFVIPEFVDNLSYFKGTYYANIGDFSSAGGAFFNLKSNLDQNSVNLTVGENAYVRAVSLHQFNVESGKLISAFEYQRYDGPWTDIREDIDKKNANLRYVTSLLNGELSITAMAYENSWNGADQVPERAIQSGIIDRLGSIDTQVGGDSSRYSLSANFSNEFVNASFYAIDTDLILFSNFTYLLENPQTGDQFEQADDRNIYGADVHSTLPLAITNGSSITLGAQWRYDDIDNVGLYRTQNLERISTTREDQIESRSYAVFAQSNIPLSDLFSLSLGARYDKLDVKVTSDFPANSDSESDGLLSLKGGLKYYLNDTVTSLPILRRRGRKRGLVMLLRERENLLMGPYRQLSALELLGIKAVHSKVLVIPCGLGT